MRFTSFLFLLCVCIVTHPVQNVQATCTASDEPCTPNSGACSEAVALGIAGDLPGASALLKYGKYCGATNKCVLRSQAMDDELESNVCGLDQESTGKKSPTRRRGLKKDGSSGGKKTSTTGKTGKKGSTVVDPTNDDPCPAVPCDPVDNTCAVHDMCLDEILRTNPSLVGQRIPVPNRCACDVAFVADLAVQATTTLPTNLCDAAFYTSPLFGLLQHEATLLAAPYCCDVLFDTDQDGTPDCAVDANTDPAQFAAASQFCQIFLGQLQAALGISVCG